MPLNYEDRLAELFPRRFKKLRIYVPDAYDLMLSEWSELFPSASATRS